MNRCVRCGNETNQLLCAECTLPSDGNGTNQNAGVGSVVSTTAPKTDQILKSVANGNPKWVLGSNAITPIALDTFKVLIALYFLCGFIALIAFAVSGVSDNLPFAAVIGAAIWLADMTFGSSLIASISGGAFGLSAGGAISLRLMPTTLTVLCIAALALIARRRARQNLSRDSLSNEILVVAGTAFATLYAITLLSGSLAKSIDSGDFGSVSASASIRPGFFSLAVGALLIATISTLLGALSPSALFENTFSNEKGARWRHATLFSGAVLFSTVPIFLFALVASLVSGQFSLAGLAVVLLDLPAILIWLLAAFSRVPILGNSDLEGASLPAGLWSTLGIFATIVVLLVIGGIWHRIRDERERSVQETLKSGLVLSLIVGSINLFAAFSFSGYAGVMGYGESSSISILFNPFWLFFACFVWAAIADLGGREVSPYLTQIMPVVIGGFKRVGKNINPEIQMTSISLNRNFKLPSKKIMIVSASAVGALLMLLVAFNFVVSRNASPEATIRALFTSLESGDIEKVRALAPTSFMTDLDVSAITPKTKQSSKALSKVSVKEASIFENAASVLVSYELDSVVKQSEIQLSLSAKKKMGLIKQWEVTSGFYAVGTIPDFQDAAGIAVNGVPIKAHGQRIVLLPGVNTLSVNTRLVTGSETVTAGLGQSAEFYDLDLSVSDQGTVLIQDAVKESLIQCASTLVAEPLNCPFRFTNTSWFKSVRTINWGIQGEPEITVDSPSTDGFRVSVSYTLTYFGTYSDGSVIRAGSQQMRANGTASITEPIQVRW